MAASFEWSFSTDGSDRTIRSQTFNFNNNFISINYKSPFF